MVEIRFELGNKEICSVIVGSDTCSGLLRELIADYDDIDVIKMTDYMPEAVKIALKYLEQSEKTEMSRIQKPLKGKLYLQISEFERELVKTEDFELIKQVMEVANFLDLEGLLDLFAAKLSEILDFSDLDAVRKVLGEENDLSPEELKLLDHSTL